MKYVSLDIETTGLNDETCQILSIGAVIEDTNNPLPLNEMPRFHCIIPHKTVYGETFAIKMNDYLISLIESYNHHSNKEVAIEAASKMEAFFCPRSEVVKRLFEFFTKNGLKGKVTVAGKNFTGFDLKFLSRLPGWEFINLHRRVIDPAPLFVNWLEDIEMPDLNTCKVRAGVAGEVTHNALEDAYDVVKVLRTKY